MRRSHRQKKTDAASPVAQAVKLFVVPEVEIKSGSKIIVTLWQFHGVHQEWRSGMHPTHQEIMLDLFKEWGLMGNTKVDLKQIRSSGIEFRKLPMRNSRERSWKPGAKELAARLLAKVVLR